MNNTRDDLACGGTPRQADRPGVHAMSVGLIWAFGLVAIGLALAALVWGLLKLLPLTSFAGAASAPAASTDPKLSEEAVVVIEPGGRVEFLNTRAHEWFSVSDNSTPDLELILREVKPAEDFLSLCAVPGRKLLNLNGTPVEVTSNQIPGSHPQMLVALRGLHSPFRLWLRIDGRLPT